MAGPGPSAPRPPDERGVEPRREPHWGRRLSAEAFGTFALVFVAAGGDAMASLANEIGPAARAVAPALVVTAMIYAIGDVSGAHLNPVVSLAFTLKRLFPVASLLPYWGAQALGGLGAALLIDALFGRLALSAGVTTPHVDDEVALVIEAVLTLLLVSVVLGTADRYRVIGPEAALAVGATIATCGLIALPIEGASMNPVRSLAPAVVSGDLGDAWIYVVGPVAGAALAVILTRFLHGATDADADARGAAQGSGGRDDGRP
jgi:MIP family channel proteins